MNAIKKITRRRTRLRAGIGGDVRRIWIISILIAVTGPALAQDRPNVVIMLADNVGYGDIGAYGAGEIRGMPTPRIDSIARPSWVLSA